jgi:DNA cross-link repair 1A protein
MLNVDKKWVRQLPMDTPTLIPDTNGVTATLIEANHCPGSCLFFFEGPQSVNAGDSNFKSPFVGSSKVFRYLHCGDFRASPQHVLHPVVRGKTIDHVYLDTTYLDPKVSQMKLVGRNLLIAILVSVHLSASATGHIRLCRNSEKGGLR